MEAGTATAGGTGAPQRLKPLDAGQTIDAAVNLYFKNAFDLWKIVAAVVLPLQLIWVIASRIILASAYAVNGPLGSGLQTTSARADGINALLVLLVVLGSLLSTGAVFKLQLDAYLGRPHTVSSSFRFAFGRHRVLSLLWISILALVLTLAGLFLLLVGAVWVWVSLAVAIPALLLEGKTGFKAVSRSFELVRRLWWPTFGRLVIAGVMLVVVYFLTSAVGLAIANSVSSPLAWLLLRAVFFSIGAILFSPFYAAVSNVIYVDLRVRKEALDSGTLGAQLDDPLASEAAPAS